MLKIIETGVVASRPKQMYGWPGMTRAANGDILVAASERKYHVCPHGREVVIRSKDNGHTWGLPQEVYSSCLDDRDVNILTLPDGTLLLSWFTSSHFEHVVPEWAGRINEETRNKQAGSWMLFSKDNGYTWSNDPIKMPVGRRISPFYFSDGALVTIAINHCDKKEKELTVWRSDDLGATWEKTWVIDCPKSKEGTEGPWDVPVLNENHALEVAPGKIVALFRCIDRYLYQACSDDYGRTWTKPQKLDIWGEPPYMLKLSDGRILCTYGHRRNPYSIRGVISYDNGKNWDIANTITLHQWDDEPDMGYPVSIEINPGEILTIFYCSRRNAPDSDCPYVPWSNNAVIGGSLPEGILYIKYRI